MFNAPFWQDHVVTFWLHTALSHNGCLKCFECLKAEMKNKVFLRKKKKRKETFSGHVSMPVCTIRWCCWENLYLQACISRKGWDPSTLQHRGDPNRDRNFILSIKTKLHTQHECTTYRSVLFLQNAHCLTPWDCSTMNPGLDWPHLLSLLQQLQSFPSIQLNTNRCKQGHWAVCLSSQMCFLYQA